MLGYLETGGCRMQYLRQELDDPGAQPCGRCDNCTGRPWPAAVSQVVAAAAGERLLRPGTELKPRQMWPAGMRELGIDVSGRIAPELQARAGRAVAALTDLGWGPRLRAALAEPSAAGALAEDAPVPADLIDAVVKILAAWDWAERPAAVATLPSRSRPGLIAGLGVRIAEIGRLPYAGSLEYATGPGVLPAAAAPPGGRQSNSAQRLRAVWGAMLVPGPVREVLAGAGGPVLLVDDRIETGWTITVAAKLLREAGAAAVLPFVLAAGG
jgi:ATP-dependent DNA helicase RecQ